MQNIRSAFLIITKDSEGAAIPQPAAKAPSSTGAGMGSPGGRGREVQVGEVTRRKDGLYKKVAKGVFQRLSAAEQKAISRGGTEGVRPQQSFPDDDKNFHEDKSVGKYMVRYSKGVSYKDVKSMRAIGGTKLQMFAAGPEGDYLTIQSDKDAYGDHAEFLKGFMDTDKFSFSQREQSCYFLSRLLGFGVVPPTMATKFHKEDGTSVESTVQLIAGDKTYAEADEELRAKVHKHPSFFMLAILDYVAGNIGRNPGNLRVDKDGRCYATDNGMSFVKADKFDDMHEKARSQFSNGIEVNAEDVPPEVVEKLRKVAKEKDITKKISAGGRFSEDEANGVRERWKHVVEFFGLGGDGQ